ncbi:hypothetical protein DYB28_004482, partial [Aphanomyces astaci]
PFVGIPLDNLWPLAYTLRKAEFLPHVYPATLLSYTLRRSIATDPLNICKMYVELDQVEHSEL